VCFVLALNVEHSLVSVSLKIHPFLPRVDPILIYRNVTIWGSWMLFALFVVPFIGWQRRLSIRRNHIRSSLSVVREVMLTFLSYLNRPHSYAVSLTVATANRSISEIIFVNTICRSLSHHLVLQRIDLLTAVGDGFCGYLASCAI